MYSEQKGREQQKVRSAIDSDLDPGTTLEKKELSKWMCDAFWEFLHRRLVGGVVEAKRWRRVLLVLFIDTPLYHDFPCFPLVQGSEGVQTARSAGAE